MTLPHAVAGAFCVSLRWLGAALGQEHLCPIRSMFRHCAETRAYIRIFRSGMFSLRIHINMTG